MATDIVYFNEVLIYLFSYQCVHKGLLHSINIIIIIYLVGKLRKLKLKVKE